MTKPVILLVDDEPWLSEGLRLALEADGFDCVTMTDMSGAVTYLESHDVAVVVTDIMMPPGANFPTVDSLEVGFVFVKIVRERWPHLPIVCLSVIGDRQRIDSLRRERVIYLRKGEIPLDSAVRRIKSAIKGETLHEDRSG